MSKKCFNPDLFMQKFRLSRKMLSMFEIISKCKKEFSNKNYEQDELSLIDNKSLSDIHLKQPECTYSTCLQFAKKIKIKY